MRKVFYGICKNLNWSRSLDRSDKVGRANSKFLKEFIIFSHSTTSKSKILKFLSLLSISFVTNMFFNMKSVKKAPTIYKALLAAKKNNVTQNSATQQSTGKNH